MNKLTALACWMLLTFCGVSLSHAQGTCGSASVLTAPGSFSSGLLTGAGASQSNATAARWYKFTPTINGNLTISSCGGGVDTRLWIWTGTCLSLQALANNDDFAGCISSGASEYASRIENLVLFAGTTYYFEWDNRWSNASFTWSFTFNALPANNDAGIVSLANQYTRIPISQADNGISLGAQIKNYSSAALTAVKLQVDIFELPNTSAPIASYISLAQTLPIGSTVTFDAGTWAPVLNATKTYQIVYTKIQPQLDAVGANDISVQTLVLDYNFFARDNGVYNAAFNWSSTNGYTQATRFTLQGADSLSGLSYYIQSPSQTQTYQLEVWAVNGGLVDATPTWSSPVIVSNGAGWKNYNLPSHLYLPAGTYLFGVAKSGTAPFPVGCATSLFSSQSSFIKVGSNDFIPIEAYSLNYVFMIRPKFGQEPPIDVAIIDHQSPGGEYTVVSTRQHPNGTPLNFTLRAQNNGAQTATNVSLKVSVKNSANVVVYEAFSASQALLPGQLDTFVVAPFVVQNVDAYTIAYEMLVQGDIQMLNNDVSTGFERSYNRLARHYGVNGFTGIGNNISSAYDNGIIGQCYPLLVQDFLDSIRFELRPGTPSGQPVRAEIYATNAAGVPIGNALAVTSSYVTTAQDNLNGCTLHLPLLNGTLTLAPGTYFIGITENAGNLRLGTSAKYQQNNRTFRRWNQNPFGSSTYTPLEQVGQLVALAISPIFKKCLPLVVSSTVTQASCGQNNGAIQLFVSGQSGSLQSTWTPSGLFTTQISNLAPGNYSTSLIDENNCTAVFSTTISLLSPAVGIQLNDLTHVSCFGQANGQITASGIAGVGPFTFAWVGLPGNLGQVTGLSAGTYNLTVTDANNCQASASYVINEPPALSLQTQIIQNIDCAGDTDAVIAYNAVGGVPGYAYFWQGQSTNSTQQNNLPTGSYQVIAMDQNACSDTAVVQLLNPLLLQINTLNLQNVSCAGLSNGNVSVQAVGGTAPYTYFWPSTGIYSEQLIGLSAGTYPLQVQDASACLSTTLIQIQEPQPLQLSTILQTPTCANSTNGSLLASAVGGTGPYNFSWLPSQTTGPNLLNLAQGTYTCIVQDANNCSTQLTSVIVAPVAIQLQLLNAQAASSGQANGGVNVAAFGGTGTLNLVWSNGQTGPQLLNVAAGTYTLLATDSLGCQLAQIFGVPNLSAPQLSVVASSNPTCFGLANGSAQLQVNSTTPIASIVWSPSPSTGQGTLQVFGLTAGTYVCSVTDSNNSVAQITVSLTGPPPLQLNVLSVTSATCYGASNASAILVPTGGTAPYTVNWPGLNYNGIQPTNLQAGSYLGILSDQNSCADSLYLNISQPGALQVTINALQAPTCSYTNNGILAASATGGTSPYTFAWQSGGNNNILLNVQPSTQSVIVTDQNGCSGSGLFLLEALSALQLSVSTTAETCIGQANGAAVLNASSGVAPYIYNWNLNAIASTSIVDLHAGTYAAAVTDSLGCIDTLTVQIDLASEASLQILDSSGLICPGATNGFLALDVLNGQPPYTLSVDGQNQSSLLISNQQAGIYQLLLTDALGCTDSLEWELSEWPFSVQASTLPALCNGFGNGQAFVQVSGAQLPYQVNWVGVLEQTDTLVGLTPGTYIYSVNDAHNCTITGSAVVTAEQSIELSAVIGNELLGVDGSIDLNTSGGTSPYTWLWSNNASTEDISTLVGGFYDVFVQDQNGCYASDTFFVDSEVGLVDINPLFTLAPNPFGQIINIQGTGFELLLIYNLQGKILFQTSLDPTQKLQQISLEQLPTAAYFFTLINDFGPHTYQMIKGMP